MKIKCENVVRCGNYNCCHNTDGYYCVKSVIALDSSGKCAFAKPKDIITRNEDRPAQNKF